MSHTPAPWFVSREGRSRILVKEGSGTLILRSGEPATVCQVMAGAVGDKQAAENARLIAAAPDLLAALKLLLSRVDHGTYPRNCDPASMVGSVLSGADLVQARAAIARALGES